MPPETSAALVVFDEQPAIVPRTTAASKPKHGLSVFIFLLYDLYGVVLSIDTTPAIVVSEQEWDRTPVDTLSNGPDAQRAGPCDHLRSTDRVWSVQSLSSLASSF